MINKVMPKVYPPLALFNLVILVIKTEEPEGVITLIVLHLQPVWKE